jgi:hypothetical protein
MKLRACAMNLKVTPWMAANRRCETCSSRPLRSQGKPPHREQMTSFASLRDHKPSLPISLPAMPLSQPTALEARRALPHVSLRQAARPRLF